MTMILVRNAKIIDGTGAPEYKGATIVSGSSISAIGALPARRAETTIDALGHYLIPGFISIRNENGNFESALSEKTQSTLRNQGFTTLITGMDGTSPAPLIGGSLAGFRKWAGEVSTNTDWHTVAQFQRALGKKKQPINIGVFAGYNGIRRAVMKDKDGDPTDRETARIISVLDEALEEGAFGISINLGTAHGARISYKEIQTAASLAARRGTPIVISPRAWTTHFMDAAQEIIAVYRATGARIIVADIAPRPFNKVEEKDFRIAHAALRETGDGIFFELHITDERHIPLYELLPSFAHQQNIESMRQYIARAGEKKRIINALPRLEGARIIRVPREYSSLEGCLLESFAANREINIKEALFELMRITGIMATIGIPTQPTPLEIELLRDSRVLVSGSPRTIFAAADAARLPMETAIMKLSGLPATVLGIERRGALEENYAADLAIMDERGSITRTAVNGNTEHYGGICIKR
jgi:N-acyl-D-amino-acid deacylase